MSSALFPKFLGAAFSITKAPRFNTLIQESTSGKELRLALQAIPRWEITLTYEYLYARQRYLAANQVPDASALIDPVNLIANDWAALAGFFAARQGAFDDFLLDDQDEDPVISEVNGLIGVGDGSTRSFQLQRQRVSCIEPVYNINGDRVLPAGHWSPGRINAINDVILPSSTAMAAQANRQPAVQSIGWPCSFKCTSAGTSGEIEPNWRLAAQAGQSVADGSVTWTNQGAAFVLYVNGAAQSPTAYVLSSTGIVTFNTPVPNGYRISWTGDFYTRVRFVRDTIEFDEFYYQFWQAKRVELISVKL